MNNGLRSSETNLMGNVDMKSVVTSIWSPFSLMPLHRSVSGGCLPNEIIGKTGILVTYRDEENSYPVLP